MIDADAILHAVCDLFGVTPAELLGRTRYKHLNAPRLALCWALRQSGVSMIEAGRAIGRDHSTVIKNAQAAERRAIAYTDYALKLLALRSN